MLFKGELIYTPQIVGTVAGDAAKAGAVGEFVQSLVPVGSSVALTTATAANITSISLTPGDWDVEANCNFNATSATTAAANTFQASISSTSATHTTDGSESFELPGTITTSSFKSSVSVSRKRYSLTTTTTLYLVATAVFSAGTVAGYGNFTARRER